MDVEHGTIDGIGVLGGSPRREVLLEAVRYATLAPSSHNTQPWRFRLGSNAIDLYADRTRRLAVADPRDRELTISCGAALFHLRLALRRAGFAPEATLLPASADPDHLARIAVGQPGEMTPDDWELYAAVPRRRTFRLPFARERLPLGLPVRLQHEAQAEGAWLDVVSSDVRGTLLGLIQEADRRLWSDPAYRRELAHWIRSADVGDGLPGPYHNGIGPVVVRAFALGRSEGRRDAAAGAPAPLVVVLGTNDDAPLAWLQAGQALARVLLRASDAGIAASFLNQPVQVPELRQALARSLDRRRAFPQVVLRMGRGRIFEPSPRRPIEAVLLI